MNDFAQIFAALVILSAICGLVLAAAKTLSQYVQRREDRKADAVSEADARATFEALSKEIERTACDIARQCEARQ